MTELVTTEKGWQFGTTAATWDVTSSVERTLSTDGEPTWKVIVACHGGERDRIFALRCDSEEHADEVAQLIAGRLISAPRLSMSAEDAASLIEWTGTTNPA